MRLHLAAAFAGLALVPGAAATRGPGEVQRAVLENGLTVLLQEDHSSPLVTVAVMYSVGARNESAGITGLAHYGEHMNFRATRRFPGTEITEAITRIGGRWNGYTWIDQTYYAETVHHGALDAMLDIELDRMAHAVYDPEDFRKERTSVLAELHSYDDPQSVLYDAVLAASFEIHPYRNNTIGWPSDVEGVTRDEAYRFYRRFYHPNNAVLAVVGNVDSGETLEKVRARFGSLPGAGESTEVRTLEPPQNGQRRVTVRRPGPHGRVLLAFRAPALGDADFPAMVLFDALLAGGKGLRFTRDYPAPANTPLQRAAAGLGRDVSSDWQASRYPYVYTLAGNTSDAAALAPLETALFRALADAEARDWTDEEIRIARRQVERGWALDLDDTAGRAHQLAFFEVSGGYRHLLELPERVRGVDRAALRRFARERLQPHQSTVGWFVPAAATPAPSTRATTIAPPAAAPASSAPPAAPAIAAAAPAPPSSFTLANGTAVTVAPVAGPGLVALRGRIDAGAMYGSALAALATDALATPRPGEDASVPPLAFALQTEPASAENVRWIAFEAAGLTEELPLLLRTLAGRIDGAASADDAAWAALRSAALERAEEHAATAETALWAEALSTLFPPGSPPSRPAWGDPADLRSATRADLQSFVRQRLRASRVHLVLAGSLDPAAARSILEDTLGRLPKGGASPRPPPPAPARGPAVSTEKTLPFPGKSQNQILVVWPGARSKAWDRGATEALLYLLGETGYAGRLGTALVSPGLVYSVYTALEEDGVPGFLSVRTAAAPGDTSKTLQLIRGILEDAARGRFTQAELDEAKAYLRGKAARGRAGAAATAATLLAESARPAGAAERLTLVQLNDTARRLFANGAPLALVAGPGY